MPPCVVLVVWLMSMTACQQPATVAIAEPGWNLLEDVSGSTPHSGLRAGDRIVGWRHQPSRATVDGAGPVDRTEPVENALDWEYLLSEVSPRGPIEVDYLREGREQTWRGELMIRATTYLTASPFGSPSFDDSELETCERQLCAPGRHAWLLFQKAQDSYQRGELERAFAQLERGDELLRETPCLARVYGNRIGRFLLERSEGAEATRYLEPEPTNRFASCPLVLAEQLALWAELLQAQGRTIETRGNLRAALSLLQEVTPESSRTAEIAMLLGLVGKRATVASETNEYFDIAEAIASKKHDLPLLAELSLVRGRLFRLTHQSQASRKALENARDLIEESPEGEVRKLRMLLAYSQLSYENGQFLEAEQQALEAVELARKYTPGGYWEGLASNMASALYYSLMEYSLAADYAERGLIIRQRFGRDTPAVLNSKAVLGELALRRGDIETAERYLLEVLEVDDVAYRYARVVALQRLGELVAGRGEHQVAEEYFRRALAESRSTRQFRRIPGILYYLARSLVAQEKWNDAEHYIQRTYEGLSKEFSGSARRGELMHLESKVARARGQGELELLHLERATEVLDDVSSRVGRSDEQQGQWSERYQPVYRSLADLYIERGRADLAFEVIERSKARRFIERLSERSSLPEVELPSSLEKAQRLTWEAYDELQQEQLLPSDGSERERELERLQRRLYRRRTELSEQARSYALEEFSKLVPEVVGTEAASESLATGSALISFEVGPERTLVFTLEPGASGPYVYTIERSSELLTRDVQQLRQLTRLVRPGYPRYEQRSARLIDSARRLCDRLLGPAQDLIQRAERLLIVPDGPLFTLPFAALVCSPDETHLGAARALHFSPSAGAYHSLSRRRSSRAAEFELDLIAFADPAPTQSPEIVPGESSTALVARSSWKPLPFARLEVEEISQLFSPERTARYEGPEATEELVKRGTLRARAIHFATHGTVDHRFPLNSGLILAPHSSQDPDEKRTENGLLQAWEVLDQVKLETDFVVLSACDTGLGSELGTEGLIGLTRAFHYAGAPSVLSSLWPVADEGTAEFMRRLYRHLREGQPLANALRTTQAEFVAGEAGARYRSPYYWAGFQLSGDWR